MLGISTATFWLRIGVFFLLSPGIVWVSLRIAYNPVGYAGYLTWVCVYLRTLCVVFLPMILDYRAVNGQILAIYPEQPRAVLT